MPATASGEGRAETRDGSSKKENEETEGQMKLSRPDSEYYWFKFRLAGRLTSACQVKEQGGGEEHCGVVPYGARDGNVGHHGA